VVLWQRADDEGRSRTPSLALREVARVTLGTSDLATVDAAAARVSADPSARVRAAVEGDAMIAPSQAGLAAAFACRSPAALLAAIDPGGAEQERGGRAWSEWGDHAAGGALAAGLDLLEAIDGPAPTPFDALVGPPGDLPRRWSPSRLETLGGCPQQFFFRHVLRVAEWDPPPGEHEVDTRAMGRLAHGVLRDLYAAAAPPDAVRLRALLEERWRGQSAAIAARMRLRYPGLWDLLEAQWLEAIELFVLADSAALAGAIDTPRLEEPAEATIPLGGDRGELRLRGRFDRLVRRVEGLVVADYKTGGLPASFVDRASILKGLRVQIPLYVLLAESVAGLDPPPPVRAEVLGVGPSFARVDPGERRAALETDRFAPLREGFLETIGVLVDLARAGLYPLDAEPNRCRRCAYALACRRRHAPTIDRLEAHPALARFRGVREKSSGAPTLADVARRPRGTD
jgi:RecB family exonuclease